MGNEQPTSTLIIIHHLIALVSAIVGYSCNMFGYAGAVTTITLEIPHLLDDVRRLLKLFGLRTHWFYLRYAIFVMVVILFNRVILFSYVTPGFLFAGGDTWGDWLFKFFLLVHYTLSSRFAYMYYTFLVKYWKSWRNEASSLVGKKIDE